MVIVVMGVVGAGKTTVGRLLAEQLGFEFADADDSHSKENIDKIRKGIALSDADRMPWLARLREKILAWEADKADAVLACSALKRSYREGLKAAPDLRFVYLKGSADLIARRLSVRRDHFADTKILATQMADLEEPADAITVDIARTPAQIVAQIRVRLKLA